MITPSLYNSFETGDLRKSAWIKVNTNKSVAYPFPYKYKQGITTATIDEFEIELRLADVYLIRAEAEIQQDQEAAALADLDMIRNRAGLSNSTATGQEAILIAIQNERRWEFFCERGNRWFDLKRWGQARAALAPLKPAWDTHDELYPIPATQINYNPHLIQNPGY